MHNLSEITDVVKDADNTLWDWISYAVPAYEAMSQHIADKMGIPEPAVAAAMKKFYTAMGTMENVFLIQGLETMGFFKQHPHINIEELLEEVQAIFKQIRRDHLKLYDGVEEVFHKLISSNKRVTILTDAPGIQAPMRLKHFGLYHEDPKKMQTFAVRAKHPKKLPKKFTEKKLRGKYDVPFKIKYIDKEKPHTNLEEILQMTRTEIRRHVLIVGDNYKKDMGLALRYGCKGLHAKYGEATPELLARLLRFAPTRIAKRNVAIEGDKTTPENDNTLIKPISFPLEILDHAA